MAFSYNTLKRRWKHLSNEYLQLFCEKHEISFDECYWIGDDPGTVVDTGDYFISMDDIRYDIDNNIEESLFSEWYWKNLQWYEYGMQTCNYSSYCKGLRLHSDEELEAVKLAHNRVIEAKKNLEEELKRCNDKDKQF